MHSFLIQFRTLSFFVNLIFPLKKVVRDDLKLLFIAAADSSYQIWRRVSSDSLMAIARHSMSGNVAHYIQSHGAIQQWVDVLRAKHIKERIINFFA